LPSSDERRLQRLLLIFESLPDSIYSRGRFLRTAFDGRKCRFELERNSWRNSQRIRAYANSMIRFSRINASVLSAQDDWRIQCRDRQTSCIFSPCLHDKFLQGSVNIRDAPDTMLLPKKKKDLHVHRLQWRHNYRLHFIPLHFWIFGVPTRKKDAIWEKSWILRLQFRITMEVTSIVPIIIIRAKNRRIDFSVIVVRIRIYRESS